MTTTQTMTTRTDRLRGAIKGTHFRRPRRVPAARELGHKHTSTDQPADRLSEAHGKAEAIDVPLKFVVAPPASRSKSLHFSASASLIRKPSPNRIRTKNFR